MFEISTKEILIYSVVFIYLIVISVFADKYNTVLAMLKKNNLARFHERISTAQHITIISLYSRQIKKLKIYSIIGLTSIYILHSFIVQITTGLLLKYLVQSTIILCISIFIMMGIFWLKGIKIINSNQRFPRPTKM